MRTQSGRDLYHADVLPEADVDRIEDEAAVLERTRLRERIAAIPSPGDDDYDPFLRGWDAAMSAVSDALETVEG